MVKRTEASVRHALADASAGAVGTLVALLVFYPIDLVKIRRQVASGKSSSKRTKAFSAKTFFRGLGYKATHGLTSSFCYYYLYSWLQSKAHASYFLSKRNSVKNKLLLSCLAAVLNTCVTLPLDVLTTQTQTQNSADEDENSEDDGEGDENGDDNDCVMVNLPLPIPPSRRKRHWTGLWAGLGPSLLLCANPSIHHTVFDVLKKWLLESKQIRHKNASTSTTSLTLAEAFALGMMAKWVATLCTYPLIVAKVRLMASPQDEKTSMWKILCLSHQKSGVRGLYVGCDLQLLHTVLKSALLMMVREHISVTTRRLLVPSQPSPQQQ